MEKRHNLHPYKWSKCKVKSRIKVRNDFVEMNAISTEVGEKCNY